MIGCAVICGAVNSIVTPIEAQRTDPFQFRFCFTTPISHGRSKRFLSLTQRPKDNRNGGLANGFSFPFQCCKLEEAEIHKDDFVVVNFYEFGTKTCSIHGDAHLKNCIFNLIQKLMPNKLPWTFHKLLPPSQIQQQINPSKICYINPQLGKNDPLANVDKEKTDILMYCTGGIRCDVYSTILRQQGFQNLYTLGGVSHYLKNEGPVKWVGNLFVFDSRLSLPPATYKPEAVNEALETEQVPKNNKFARCYICGSQVCELRHRNCANIDCNLLFLCCLDCVKDFRGCCCVNCTSAPRLRPALLGHQRYKKWHIYRDSELHGKLVA
ncbi:hypothetical protein UlMin_043668 [Ulmus minor]